MNIYDYFFIFLNTQAILFFSLYDLIIEKNSKANDKIKICEEGYIIRREKMKK